MTGIFEHSGNLKSSTLAFIISFSVLDEQAQYPCKRAVNGGHPGLTCLLNIRVDFSDVFIMALLKVLLMWRMQKQHTELFHSLWPQRATTRPPQSTWMSIFKSKRWLYYYYYFWRGRWVIIYRYLIKESFEPFVIYYCFNFIFYFIRLSFSHHWATGFHIGNKKGYFVFLIQLVCKKMPL